MTAVDFTSKVLCAFTDDSSLSADNPVWRTPDEVVVFLNASPRNAVVITDLVEASGECVATTPQYVLRGASERPDNFYFGSVPAEDPNDANGGDLTAKAALNGALDGLCG